MPNTLLRATYCSNPYFADGMQVVSAIRDAPVRFLIVIAAILALAPTKSAVASLPRNG